MCIRDRMFTTLGSSCLEIWEKAFESCCGAGMVSGVASDDFCPSLPFTPEETTVPIRIPTVSVARIVKVYAQRLALRRTQKALSRESISYLLKLPSLLLYLRPRQASSKGSKSLDAEKAVGVNHRLPGAKGEGCCGGGALPRRDGAKPRPHTTGYSLSVIS